MNWLQRLVQIIKRKGSDQKVKFINQLFNFVIYNLKCDSKMAAVFFHLTKKIKKIAKFTFNQK